MKFHILVILILVFAGASLAQKPQKTKAEIVVPLTYLRKSHNPDAKKIYALNMGRQVTIEENLSKDGWFYVSVLDGKVFGWISENVIKLVD